MLKVVKKLPFWQRNVMVPTLTQEQIDVKYRRRCCRTARLPDRNAEGKVIPGTERLEGKTAKDHRTGSWSQRFTRVGSQFKNRQQHRGDVADG